MYALSVIDVIAVVYSAHGLHKNVELQCAGEGGKLYHKALVIAVSACFLGAAVLALKLTVKPDIGVVVYALYYDFIVVVTAVYLGVIEYQAVVLAVMLHIIGEAQVCFCRGLLCCSGVRPFR